MAEQAVNTIYALGDQPDALCSVVLREMTTRVFGPKAAPAPVTPDDGQQPDEDAGEPDVSAEGETVAEKEDTVDGEDAPAPASQSETRDPAFGNTFELSQLIFVAGHCAIKQLVHLELVERDIKRRKAADDKKAGAKAAGQDELDQVAGSVEDEIGDVIAATKERELLYGPQSLLSVFGPMAATIVSQPKIYRVRFLLWRVFFLLLSA
jgi:condensin complex subunit 1